FTPQADDFGGDVPPYEKRGVAVESLGTEAANVQFTPSDGTVELSSPRPAALPDDANRLFVGRLEFWRQAPAEPTGLLINSQAKLARNANLLHLPSQPRPDSGQ